MGSILLKDIVLKGEETDILINGSRISRIGRISEMEMPSSDMEVVDCKGKTAFPGFVNMHTHAGMAMMRGIGEDISFHAWIDKIWEVEQNLDEEYVYHGSKVAFLEMIKTGTTTFNDQYWYMPMAQKAAAELGLRSALSYVMLDKNDPEEAERQKIQCEQTYKMVSSWPETASFLISIHSVYSVQEPMILWAADFARKHGLKIHIHVSETRKEVEDCMAQHGGLSPVEYLESLGVLGPDVIAAHTLWLSDNDVRILGKHGVTCVHNINSNLKLASGYKFRYNELRDAGANVCLGTDGSASSNNLDMLETMKTASMVQKAWREDPSAMPLDELIRMATVNGGKALGLDVGRIEEGALADILIIDTDNYNFVSPGSFEANLVYSAHSDCIDSVICNGRFLMRGRVVEGEKEILAQARKVMAKFSSRG
jgi:5-methylthioadenosine/S-adenosylhomocysteine deaminase